MSAHDDGDALVIGLVNNMPDGAFKTTERQFRELLTFARGDTPIRLRLFSLPEAVRAEATRAYITDNYEKFGNLWTARLDGLIVTGTEPRTAVLTAEPYWQSLTKLVDWAQENTTSTVWSCLAAHGAVYHLDGIERQKYPEKLSGVFECARAGVHRLLADAPDTWRIPHSRSNDLPARALTAAGYQILSTSPVAGADMFIKQTHSLFVFLQGHPEYDPDSLLREFHRDIGRFLKGEREAYPQMPRGYFDAGATAALTGFRERALVERNMGLLEDFPAVDVHGASAPTWRLQARLIYANWLTLLRQSRLQARANAL
jgi:homoserine O-succinyltransferase/O-acetyltransferase